MDRWLLDSYRNGFDNLSLAVRGLTLEDMQQFPVPGTWSINQIVWHLVDADLVIADRMKRVIAEENPALLAFDQSLWMQNLNYNQRPIEPAMQLFQANRLAMGPLLEILPDDVFNRFGQHNERGPLSLKQLLEFSISHLDHHLKFIHEKRAIMGKEMW